MSERILARPSVTVATIVERDGRFLFVEEETRAGRKLNQPAGHLESGESLPAAAVRETLEETGVDIARDGRVIGRLDDLSPNTLYLPPIIIRPYVALVRANVEIVPSAEVAQAFWVPLAELRTPAAWGTAMVTMRGIEQAVSVFKHGEYTVWGLTERVLRQFLDYVGADDSRDRN